MFSLGVDVDKVSVRHIDGRLMSIAAAVAGSDNAFSVGVAVGGPVVMVMRGLPSRARRSR